MRNGTRLFSSKVSKRSFFAGLAALTLVGLTQTVSAEPTRSCPVVHAERAASVPDPKLIREILRLQHGDPLKRSLYKKYEVNEIATAIVHRVRADEEKYSSKIIGTYDHKAIDLKKETDIMLFFWSRDFESIKTRGFLNQHQSCKSCGTYSPENRKRAEDLVTGIALGDSPEAIRLRPKSAFLNVRAHGVFAQQEREVAGFYGDIAAVLKNEIKERSLWTADDSLGIGTWEAGTETPAYLTELRGSFHRPSISKKSLPWGSYYEALIYGTVDFSHVDYFLTNNTAVIQDLKKIGKPIYSYVERMKNGRIIYEKENLIFEGLKEKARAIPLSGDFQTVAGQEKAS